MKKLDQGFALIIALVLIALVVVGYFGYKNYWPKPQTLVTPSPTTSQAPNGDLTNWKTFRTETFSIKYPPEWQEPEKYLQSMRVEYAFLPNNLSIVEGSYYDQILQKPRTYAEEVANQEKYATGKEEIVVNGEKTTKFTHRIGESTFEEAVVLESPAREIFWISMPFPPDTNPAIFDQILSTFRFLK